MRASVSPRDFSSRWTYVASWGGNAGGSEAMRGSLEATPFIGGAVLGRKPGGKFGSMASKNLGPSIGGIVAWTLLAPLASAQSPSTVRVSLGSNGVQADGDSYNKAMSADGRYVAFMSTAGNLASGEVNVVGDIFIRDRISGTTERVSASSSGVGGNDSSGWPAISADGRFVVFWSIATNLVPNDTNNAGDVFLRDCIAGTTERLSLGPGGYELNWYSWGPSISADGRYVAFQSNATNLPNNGNGWARLLVFDRQVGQSEVLSPTASNDLSARLSADGRYIGYTPAAGDQAMLYDRQTATSEVVSVAGGSPAPGASVLSSLSPDGRFVVFWSTASNLVMGDTNGHADVFLRDRQVGATFRISVDSNNSEGNAECGYGSAISADGRFVSFESDASNLVANDVNAARDVFLRDRDTNTTTLISTNTAGVHGNLLSADPAMSPNGRFVAFLSRASNLVGDDSNGAIDIFLRDRGIPPPEAYCTAKVSSLGCTPAIGWSGSPSVSGPDTFHVTASNVLSRKLGIMIWSGSSASVPLYGGTRCVASPIIRTPGQNSGGNTPPTDCSGLYSFHFSHSYMTSHFLGVGSTVCAQFWSRDPGFPAPNNIGLTDGLQFVIAP